MANCLAAAATVLMAFLLTPGTSNALTLHAEAVVSEIFPVPEEFVVEPGDAVILDIQGDSLRDPDSFEGTIQLGGVVFPVSGGQIFARDSPLVGGGYGDSLTIHPRVPSEPSWSFLFYLLDSTGEAISDDPPTDLMLTDFDRTSLTAQGPWGVSTPRGPTYIHWFVGSLTAFHLVPEPATGLLVVTGLLGLGLAGRRRNQLD